jgi:hypothetical protein
MIVLNYLNILALMFLMLQCQDTEELIKKREVKFNEEFVISNGEQVKVVGQGEPLLVTLNQIEDSRCPSDVTCIWAGNATIVLMVANKLEQDQTVRLCIGDCKSGPIRSNHLHVQKVGGIGYEFTLLDVMPYPNTSTKESGKDSKLIIRTELK